MPALQLNETLIDFSHFIFLQSLLSQHYEKHPIVILKDVRFEELKATMEYMYKGEVNINQDALGQFLKVAETLQIKGLTDGNIGDDKPSQKRHEPPQVRKPAAHQSRSSVTLPPNSSGQCNYAVILLSFHFIVRFVY